MTKVGLAYTVSLTRASLRTVLVKPGLHGPPARENVPSRTPLWVALSPLSSHMLEFGVWGYIPEWWSADCRPIGWRMSQGS